MGQTVSKNTPIVFFGPYTPEYENTVNADPQYGFTFERKEREMVATPEDLMSTKIDIKYRDFCAHRLIDYKACQKEKFPFFYRCAPQRHAFNECQWDDQLIRMKEYERERRLRERQLRKDKLANLKAERAKINAKHRMHESESFEE